MKQSFLSPLLQFSQLLEEKNTLSVQLGDTSQSLRESQQHYTDLFNHCTVLEKQVQELQAVSKKATRDREKCYKIECKWEMIKSSRREAGASG